MASITYQAPAIETQFISQMEYVTYDQYFKDIAMVENACEKNQSARVRYNGYQFVKLKSNEARSFNTLPPNEINQLKTEIRAINLIHGKLKGSLVDRTPDDLAPLAANIYNTNIKIIEKWNNIFKNLPELQIIPVNETLYPKFADRSMEQLEDEEALKGYFEDLEKYPKLKHLNSSQTGHYAILYDPQDFQRVRQKMYNIRFAYYQSLMLSKAQAHQLAMKDSRIGKVWSDRFWTIYRDAVTNGKDEFTYNRLVWNCDKAQVGGTAVLPIINTPEGKKIVVQVAGRHATGSLEVEIARGASKLGENNPEDTAKRELEEETGFKAGKLKQLGHMAVDTGLTASIVPIYMGEVNEEVGSQHDKREAINGRYELTFEEIKKGFQQGYLELLVKGQTQKVPLRDPFLAYGLLMAIFDHQFDDEMNSFFN